jgi:hypothetical protein
VLAVLAVFCFFEIVYSRVQANAGRREGGKAGRERESLREETKYLLQDDRLHCVENHGDIVCVCCASDMNKELLISFAFGEPFLHIRRRFFVSITPCTQSAHATQHTQRSTRNAQTCEFWKAHSKRDHFDLLFEDIAFVEK